jgi:hypothetical protein
MTTAPLPTEREQLLAGEGIHTQEPADGTGGVLRVSLEHPCQIEPLRAGGFPARKTTVDPTLQVNASKTRGTCSCPSYSRPHVCTFRGGGAACGLKSAAALC